VKYFNWAQNAPLAEADGCPYDQWADGAGRYVFARHPGGFRVFLRPSEIAAFDEYAGGDPYTFCENAPGDFHPWRCRMTIRMLSEHFGPAAGSARVLDVGCGEGHITAAIRSTFPQAEISGLDCSLTAISHAVQAFSGIDFIVGNAYDLPYSRGYFDAVVCNNIWEHVPDPLRLLQAISRVLRPEGVLILSTPNRYHVGNLAHVLTGRPVSLRSEHHVTEYTIGQVLEQLRFGGFTVRRIECGPPIAGHLGLKGFVLHRVLRPMLALYLRLVRSHHRLDSTVFYMAVKDRL
jgi:SAM-dependent methyltransferase